MSEKRNTKTNLRHKVLTVIGTVMCVILIPILLTNVLLIVKSYTEPEKVPDIGGVMPLIVMTDSMYPEIQSGDLIICKEGDPAQVRVGDIVAFFDPAGSGTSVVTHRVVEITEEDGALAFRTKGDANNVEDSVLVKADKLVGVYWKRIPSLGNVAMFMQTTTGLVVCVVLPLVLLIAYDLIRSRRYEKKKQADTDALLAELEALKAKKASAEEDHTPAG